ncbi:hypothetical protein BZA70DRAFT_279794 [Myxozyma melibiosi]|uniref:Nucleotide exchange factor SIL1 n=1 Tax=Myxozyma melibiosi TaxID=54550 RepID=A0ABR1F4B8_9ASCO
MRIRGLCYITCAIASAVALVGAVEADSNGMICPDDGSGACYSQEFVPTEEFQQVKPGQNLPPGVHVRLNFETGVREAKLLAPEGADDDEDSTAVVVVPGGESVTVETSEEDDAGASQDTDSFTAEEEQQDRNIWGQFSYSHKPNPHISLSDHEDFESTLAYALSAGKVPEDDSTAESATVPPTSSELAEAATDSEGPYAVLLTALRTIEDYAHEIDFGIKLADPETVTDFLAILGSHPHAPVRALAARVIGSSLRNNAPALDIAAPARVVSYLLSALESENDAEVRKRIMFALASSIHGRFGRQEFWSQNGGEILRRKFYTDGVGEDYMGRCGTFVEDSFVNSESESSSASQASNEIQKEMGLWCAAFQDALSQDNISSTDARDKIFSALSAIKSKYPTYCPVQDSFRAWIAAKVDQRAALKQRYRSDAGAAEKADELPNSGLATRDEDGEVSGAEMGFLDKLFVSRHSLFGNPKAMRKAFDDEL